ncbi:MAG TPA: DUF2911 domain-containing protein [Blastocatellia bacterium]|nr:DUF2911 domain-containing protein [Blastocatellia bacterium]
MTQRVLLAIILLFCASACARRETARSTEGNSNESARTGPARDSGGTDRGRAVLRVEGGTVSVEYGRPALKGRDLEQMMSPGQEWRMGSNAATTLSTDVDLKFGDRLVPKGDYVLKAKLDDQRQWHLIAEKEGGAAAAEIPLSFRKADNSVELLTIELKERDKGGALVLQWGDLMLSTDFEKA